LPHGLWSERRAPNGKTSDGGFVTRTMAHVRLAGKMTHDDLVCRHDFPPVIIRQPFGSMCVSRFTIATLKILLAERGLDVSYETVRRWVWKFGRLFARELRRRRPRSTSQWHLDEMAVTIAGRQFWLWRAVDDEGEAL
jgi:DDE domain